MSTPTSADVAASLQAFARAEIDSSATVTTAWPMPGNAGLSFGADVITPASTVPLVIRLAPPGVRRSGNTDVLRVVPLLQALAAAGVPVAAVRWAVDDAQWFGTDAVLQDRLDALPLHMSHAEGSATLGVTEALTQAVDALARMHAVPAPEGWELPRTLPAEIGFWTPLLGKASDPEWASTGTALHDALLAGLPADPDTGILHGDFHTNNVLFDAVGRLVAIVDWEISGVGAHLLDLAWLAIFTDPGCWAQPHGAGMRVTADAGWLRERYEQASGRPTDRFDWFRALACFRFGVISVFNVRLHRTGRRVDATWEERAESILPLFRRGLRFLEEEK
ncbi:phosphotransferase [Pseudonocardia sp. GCM10023141]|uniref:phosphotransferase n=1 Tax=Pseudonocardia sp. GCM10023141 TaxID=3252653 RepID=UPI00361548DA